MTNEQIIAGPGSPEATLSWIQDDNLEQYKPCLQVYGVVFNLEGQILLIQEKGTWKIPGGTPEGDETAGETLRRELIEEADVTVGQVAPVGVQQVEYPNNPNPNEGNLFYQYRYACLLDELQPSSPDPDTGITNPRMFVPAEAVTSYVKWGEVGDAMFKAAIGAYKEKLASQ
jgi:ADP-ribose pyrophosphatase YjhB (NUDIX family)